MGKNDSLLFDTIAPVYGLFYHRQKRRYRAVINQVSPKLNLTQYDTVLDVGCGTGALCSVLHERGFTVTGIDPARKMLQIAKDRPENKQIRFLQADVLRTLPFADKAFDVSIASYVAHGLPKNERLQMYAEMSRVTKSKVIVYDYNQNRSLLTTIAEWLERGDYFNFIKDAKEEMEQCAPEMQACFSDVRVIDLPPRAAWYICTPT